jgi:hypothetical protein
MVSEQAGVPSINQQILALKRIIEVAERKQNSQLLAVFIDFTKAVA